MNDPVVDLYDYNGEYQDPMEFIHDEIAETEFWASFGYREGVAHDAEPLEQITF